MGTSMLEEITVNTLYSDILYNIKILYNVNCIYTNVKVSLNLKSLQQKFSLTSSYLGTNSVAVKRAYAIFLQYKKIACVISFIYLTNYSNI